MPQLDRRYSVEEFHGPYGPYQVSELVLQKIWLERAFDVSRMCDQSGRLIEVEHPGAWNRLEGPDFKNAVLRIDGVEVRGDVEVHFSQADWRAHQHDIDPAYDRVVLHVLYYTPAEGATPSRTSRGDELARVCLLPLLWYSLEEYAGEDSLIASTGVDLRPEVESLLVFELPERRRQLMEHAKRRWRMKCHYAAQRIGSLGWQKACHQSALEVMGFARNRVPMLMIAERFSLEEFARDELELEALLETAQDRWRFAGCRPANHPKTRLGQYRQLARERPDWPHRLRDWGLDLNSQGLNTTKSVWGSSVARSSLGIRELRMSMGRDVLAESLSGARIDTLVCDALLPLLASETRTDLFAHWFHWNPGNGPDSCADALKLLQVLEPRKIPMSNGWLQGILGVKRGALQRREGTGQFQAHA